MSAPNLVVDYYALLEIDRSADHEAIGHAVRQQRRRWVTRQNSPSLTKQREAEDRLVSIAAAEYELLDPTKRRDYDNRLFVMAEVPATLPPNQAPPPPLPAPRTNWTARAREELHTGDLRGAKYSAKEATESNPHDDEAWALRAQVSRASNRWEDAIIELTEALKFRRRAAYFAQLGEINQAVGQWEDAVAAFRAAGELEPAEPAYDLAAAQVWLSQYRSDLALPILESLHARHPGSEDISRSLAYALLANVSSYLTVLHDNSVIFTSVPQIDQARMDVQRALSLPFQDDGLRGQLTALLERANQATMSVWTWPRGWARWLGWVVAGWLALAIPMSAVKSPAAIGVMLGFLALAGVVWGFCTLYRKPGWERNTQQFRGLVGRWGI